jgi:hypothetical protein
MFTFLYKRGGTHVIDERLGLRMRAVRWLIISIIVFAHACAAAEPQIPWWNAGLSPGLLEPPKIIASDG